MDFMYDETDDVGYEHINKIILDVFFSKTLWIIYEIMFLLYMLKTHIPVDITSLSSTHIHTEFSRM